MQRQIIDNTVYVFKLLQNSTYSNIISKYKKVYYSISLPQKIQNINYFSTKTLLITFWRERYFSPFPYKLSSIIILKWRKPRSEDTIDRCQIMPFLKVLKSISIVLVVGDSDKKVVNFSKIIRLNSQQSKKPKNKIYSFRVLTKFSSFQYLHHMRRLFYIKEL